jgi:hypothetical protein
MHVTPRLRCLVAAMAAWSAFTHGTMWILGRLQVRICNSRPLRQSAAAMVMIVDDSHGVSID